MPALMQRLRGRAEHELARVRLTPTARRVADERLTYLPPVKLGQIERALKAIESDGVPGGLVECGVALGGSAVLLARHALAAGRTFDGYDVFGMIPAPGPEDPPEVHERYRTIAAGQSEGIGGDRYYGYRDDLLEHVTATLARYEAPIGERVHLHSGLFEETLHPAGPVAFAHIDCDWYEPVKLCLERLYPHLEPGALVAIDDYHDYAGARKATDEFLAEHGMGVVTDRAHLILRR